MCFTSKTRVSALAPAPFRAVRISGITRSNSAVGLIDARGLTTSHSRHILMGISYRQGLARSLLVPSKENKRRDIRALFQRRGPFCLCLISLREKWKEGQPISLAPTAEPGASEVKRRWSRVSAAQLPLSIPQLSLSILRSLCFWISSPRRLCSFDYREIRSHNTGGRLGCGAESENREREKEMDKRMEMGEKI